MDIFKFTVAAEIHCKAINPRSFIMLLIYRGRQWFHQKKGFSHEWKVRM